MAMATSSRNGYKKQQLRHELDRNVTPGENIASSALVIPNDEIDTNRVSVVKLDPRSIYKSKRYRDKLRTEIKGLESLLPVDKSSVHRKLDSQTVFRLCIAYFRTKLFLQAANFGQESNENIAAPPGGLSVADDDADSETPGGDTERLVNATTLLEMLDGFLLVVTADGTILFVSNNILKQLGFNQVDLMLRCIYGIVHPDDHEELKMVLEQTLSPTSTFAPSPDGSSTDGSETASQPGSSVSFLCRMKCFSGTTTGYLKMHCIGHMRSFPATSKSQRTSNQVLFAFCRPFIPVNADIGRREGSACAASSSSLWTKHELDLRFKQMDDKVKLILGYDADELVGRSLYEFIHPEDLSVFRYCHKALIHTEDIQTLYFRAQRKDGAWLWLHTRGKVVFKSSKKYSIVFTHCPVREEDSTYIQQEAVVRRRYAIEELMCGQREELLPSSNGNHFQSHGSTQLSPSAHSSQNHCPAPSSLVYGGLKDDAASSSLHDPHGHCPSSWHTSADRHSPVFPNTQQIPMRHQQQHQQHQLSPLYDTNYNSDIALHSAKGKKRKNEVLGLNPQPTCQRFVADQWYSDHDAMWSANPDSGHNNVQSYASPMSDNHHHFQNSNVPPAQFSSWVPSCSNAKSLQGNLQPSWPVAPYTMVIEGRLTINSNQVPTQSCCYYKENNYQSAYNGNTQGTSNEVQQQWMSLQDGNMFSPVEKSPHMTSSPHSASANNRQVQGMRSTPSVTSYYDYPEIASCFDSFPADNAFLQKMEKKSETLRSDCCLQSWI